MLMEVNMLKRIFTGFINSALCGLMVNLIIEVSVRMITGDEGFYPMSPEYMSLFPSASIAVEVNAMLYGLIGAAFAGMSFIYEKDSIGFIIQNIIYLILTSVFWIPIVMFVWQLHRYQQAFICTLSGFAATYVIMSVVGYKIAKQNIKEINILLESEQQA